MSARMKALRPYLPCFFDIPFKDALDILGCSHHTLDPIRRAMNMDRWPFAEILRGEFCDRNEIVALRARMMSQASEDMQRCLCLVATRAEERWRLGAHHRRRRRPKQEPKSCAECQQPPNSPSPPQEHPDAQVGVWGDEDVDEADRAFWEDMSEFFHLKEAVTPPPETAGEREAVTRPEPV
jgi:hypothetical protein